MSPPRHPPTDAADALVAVAPLVSRWIDRLLAGHDPPLTVAQFLALRAIGTGAVSGSELARRAGVSGPAVSQLLSGLAGAGLLERRELDEDRRRQALGLSRERETGAHLGADVAARAPVLVAGRAPAPRGRRFGACTPTRGGDGVWRATPTPTAALQPALRRDRTGDPKARFLPEQC